MRQTETGTDTQRDRETHRETETGTDTQRDRELDRQTQEQRDLLSIVSDSNHKSIFSF